MNRFRRFARNTAGARARRVRADHRRRRPHRRGGGVDFRQQGHRHARDCRRHLARCACRHNAPIVSGKIIETSPNAQGFDEGNSATGIGLDVNAITQANGQKRLGDNVGGDGSLSSLVLETKNDSRSYVGSSQGTTPSRLECGAALVEFALVSIVLVPAARRHDRVRAADVRRQRAAGRCASRRTRDARWRRSGLTPPSTTRCRAIRRATRTASPT